MRITLFALKMLLVTPAFAAVSVLHHGHIAMFLAEVHNEIVRAGAAVLRRRHRIVVASSMLQIWFDDPAVHYEVAIHRKNRSVEVGLHFEGEPAANRQWLDALVERESDIRRQLDLAVEFEQWTRKWTRVHQSTVVPGDDWRPKRDLTPSFARVTARRLLRMMRVLEPMLDRERAANRRV